MFLRKCPFDRKTGGPFDHPFDEAVKEPLRWVLFDNLAPRFGAVSLGFLQKTQRVTVFLTIITQITAKNHPVGAAALSGPCPLIGTNPAFFTR
jgi:hypothetical protein